jgi:nucleotide-binding universal stress UspA family protein
MKTILVPTDFSPSSERALDFAVQIAKKWNAKIILANAYYLPTFDLDAPPSMLQTMYDKEDKEIKSKLHEICLKTAKNTNPEGASLACEYVAELKLPVQEIHDLVVKKGVDLIVMGTEGKDKVLGFLGSITMEVLNRVRCPVLIIKEDFEYRDFNHIAYALEDIEKDISTIDQLIPFAKLFDAEIKVIHVKKNQKQNGETKDPGKLIPGLKKSAGYEKIKLYEMFYDDVPKGLTAFFNSESYNLMVLMKHERNWVENIFHKSVIKHLMAAGNTPLLILHKK